MIGSCCSWKMFLSGLLAGDLPAKPGLFNVIDGIDAALCTMRSPSRQSLKCMYVNEQGGNDLSNATHLQFRQRWIIERG